MTFNPFRRQLLGRASWMVGAACLAQGAPFSAGAKDTGPAPRDVGRKFYANGKVRPFLGNTIICHLPQQGDGFQIFDAVLDIYRELADHAFSRKITILPPSSYHMTIFGGANDQERKPGLWPADIALDTPMARCNSLLAERLRSFALEAQLPIRMRVDDSPSAAHPDPLLIDLVPIDAAESKKLRRLRDRLSETLKIRAPDHDRYAFHISLAYQIAWFDPNEQADYVATRQRWLTQLKHKTPIIEFGAPEYCTLEDMFAFRRRLFIT